MAKHESPARSDEWYTPSHVFEALGVRFDLDAAAPEISCPADNWCGAAITSASLSKRWRGFVWLNPPFGGRNGIVPWLTKFMAHGDGVALTPDRTSCEWWQAYARQADAVLFWAPKIHFIPGPGAVASSPAQGTTLMAKGAAGVAALKHAERAGHGLFFQPGV